MRGRTAFSATHPRRSRRSKPVLECLEPRYLYSAALTGEILVNTDTAGSQHTTLDGQAVAVDSTGRSIVVWSGSGTGDASGIYARRYDAAGNPLGADFRVNTFTAGVQTAASVATDSAGNFVVVWASQNQDTSGYGVYAQRYNAAGAAQGGEFRVNATFANDQFQPSVAMDQDGDFVVSWTSEAQDGDGLGVYARRFNAAGVAQGGELLVAAVNTAADQQHSRVAMDAAGNFVVTWQSYIAASTSDGIYARRYSAAGVAQPEFLVNTFTTGDQTLPAIGMNDSGAFVIAWTSIGQDGSTPASNGVYAQRYTAAGAVAGAEFRVSFTVAGDQQYPSVAIDNTGAFVIAWQSAAQDGSGWGTYAREYTAAGAARGGEARLNATTAGDQALVSLAGARGTGNYFAVWGGNGGGDSDGVFTRLFQPTDPGITVTPTSGLTTTEAGGTATFTIVLNSPPTANVTIDLSTSDATEGTVSVAQVIFTPANWDTAQTVTVTGVNDAFDDGDIAYSIVTAAAVSTDAAYSGMNPANVAVTNTDNDVASIAVSPGSGLVTTEAGGTATFSVVLTSMPTANVTINLSSSDATEGTISTGVLTFTPASWNVAQTVTVTGVGDAFDDGDVAYSIVTAAATSADSVYNGMNAANVSVTNLDDDTAGIAVNATSGLVTTEAAGTATFTVVLTSVPTANVTIAVASSDTTEATVSTATLTFTPANWNVPQTVTLTGQDDSIADGDVAYNVVLTPSSSDGTYAAVPPAIVARVNRDDVLEPPALGTEFRINTTTADVQNQPAVGTDADGNYVVVWTSKGQDGNGKGVYARLYRADGTPLTGEFVVNTTTAGDQDAPAVAMNARGDFVISWASKDPSSTAKDVYAQRFSPAGARVGGEFRVNTTLGDVQDQPAVAIDPAGAFVVSWKSAKQDGSGTGIYARRFDETGLPAGVEFIVNTSTTDIQDQPTAAMDGAGNLVIAWKSNKTDGSGAGVYARGFNSDGTPTGPQFQVNVVNAGNQDKPTVAMNAAGAFVIIWATDNQDGDRRGVFGRLYAATGAPAGGEFLVNTVTRDSQDRPSVGMNDAGGFVVAYVTNLQDGNGKGIWVRHYDPAGNPLGSAQVNTTWAGNQDDPAVAVDASGDFIVVWQGNGVGDAAGVFAQRYRFAGVTVSPTSGLTTTEGGGSATFTVVLNRPPVGDVSIDLSSSDPNEGTLSASRLTFTPANWNIPQAVTVTGINDFIADGAATYSIGGTVSSSDGRYQGLAMPAVGVTNQQIPDAGGATPVARDDSYSLSAGGTLRVADQSGVLRNDIDPDATGLTALLFDGPTHGTLALRAGGGFVYTPDAGFSGVDGFRYRASDGSGVSTPAEVTIAVAAVPPPPVPPPPVPPPVPPAPVPSPLPPPVPPALPVSPDNRDLPPAQEPPTEEKKDDGPTVVVPPSNPPPLFGGAEHPSAPVRPVTPVHPSGDPDDLAPHPPPSGGERPVVKGPVQGPPRPEGPEVNPLPDLGVPTLALVRGSTTPLAVGLDNMARQIGGRGSADPMSVRAVRHTFVAITVGYVVWSLRGASLLASLLTSMPLWRSLDPLPILENRVAAEKRKQRRRWFGRRGRGNAAAGPEQPLGEMVK